MNAPDLVRTIEDRLADMDEADLLALYRRVCRKNEPHALSEWLYEKVNALDHETLAAALRIGPDEDF